MSSCKNAWGKPKIGHPTKEEAEQHRLEQIERANHVHDYRVYRCFKCKLWHIGRMYTKSYKLAKKYELRKEEAMVGKLIGILKKVING